MDLIDVKISEIKNLSTIFVYNTDSIFTKDENKYLGMRVSYANSKDYIKMDYKDPHFPTLVKKIISRYYQEKDNRNIILLGDLTKRLIEDDEIRKVCEERQDYNSTGLTLFSTSKEKLASFEPYLKETLKFILKHLKRYELVTIDNIDGYNKKFIVEYSIGPVVKKLPLVISFTDEKTISFRIGMIDGEAIDVHGVITNNLNQVVITWESKSKNANGLINYDVADDIVEKKVRVGETDTFHQTDADTIIDSDIELIKFYLGLFGITWEQEFIKTDDYNFIFGYAKKREEKDTNLLIESCGMQLYITDDEVVLRHVTRDSLNKYDSSLNIDLDEELCEITVKKIEVGKDINLLIEKTSTNSIGKKYEYVVYNAGDIDFHKPFTVYDEVRIKDEVKSIHDVINKTLELRGGNN